MRPPQDTKCREKSCPHSSRPDAGTVEIRLEQPADIPVVRAVNTLAFGRTGEAVLVDQLRAGCPDCLSLVGCRDGCVAGHVLFSPVHIEAEPRTIEGMGLGPVAVLPEFQRQGIGARMIEAGLAHLRRAACPLVVVLGHHDYYARFGFAPASRHGLRCQWAGVPDEAFMALVLNAEAMQGVTGVVRYRAEFNAVA